MKCNRLLLVVSMVLVVAFCVASASDQVVVEYSFERPDVQTVTIDGEMYDRVIMEGAPNGGNAGQPALPAQGASILLPFGTEVKSVTIIKGDRISLGMEYYIEPCGIPIRLSAERGEIVPPVPDEAIYNTDSDFPGSEFEEIGTHIFRGYSILNLKLMPVQYNPVSGELCYYPDL
ncbi:MAG: C25 family peptidase propeptide domain-containing protein, partial [candidate division Zixibacteria bacterium]|nr:C25 family peptidase propeptide domain-containing protein [candidate division Zixibacteria bacterium]